MIRSIFFTFLLILSPSISFAQATIDGFNTINQNKNLSQLNVQSKTHINNSNTPSLSQSSKIYLSNGQQPCWDEAARYHGLDPWLLYAVAYVESSHNPTVISKPNRNGTYDIGLMQINSIWLPELKKYGITQSTLKNACASTFVGAWVMAKNIKRYGYTWKAIAAYNVGSLNTEARRKIGHRYATKVYAAYDKLSKVVL